MANMVVMFYMKRKEVDHDYMVRLGKLSFKRILSLQNRMKKDSQKYHCAELEIQRRVGIPMQSGPLEEKLFACVSSHATLYDLKYNC